jgi:hypothetical protein
MDCREGPASCISGSGEETNDEDGNRQRLDPRKREHNRVIRITVGPSEPCCSPSRPTVVKVTRCNMSLEVSNAKSIRRSARKKTYACQIRRAEPENAAAIEAAAPSAHYYEHERSHSRHASGQPVDQLMGCLQVRIPLLSRSTIIELTNPWGRRMGATRIVAARLRDQSANGEERMCALRRSSKRMCGLSQHTCTKERECAHLGKNMAGHGI